MNDRQIAFIVRGRIVGLLGLVFFFFSVQLSTFQLYYISRNYPKSTEDHCRVCFSPRSLPPSFFPFTRLSLTHLSSLFIPRFLFLFPLFDTYIFAPSLHTSSSSFSPSLTLSSFMFNHFLNPKLHTLSSFPLFHL